LKVLGVKQPIVRKKDDRYEIHDLHLDDFTLSITQLNQGQSTTGHSHNWEEAYYIIKGQGRILVGDAMHSIKAKDFILIPKGDFHRVYNNDDSKLVFLCIFRKNQENID
jgi:quercetin dioxygenase-like cupin family protein